ncbi:MAG TPA: DNA-binding response regulator [Microscillaceae bacterium]|nr:DNA-binding response regulator [Microscillaceae bacterium]
MTDLKPIHCIIIEDEPFAQKLLQSYIDKIPYLELLATFTNPIEAYPLLHQQTVDLVFLDIEMPQLNGMQFLESLAHSPKIIFTTAYSQYAVESYEKNALDYLLKPITFERFMAAVNKFPQNLESSSLPPQPFESTSVPPPNQHIFVKVDRQLIKLLYQDILYVESLRDYVQFYTLTARHIVYHSLKKLEQLLPNPFQRVHHSYIVNLDHLEQIRDNHIVLPNKKIPISKKYRDSVLNEIQKRLI